MLSPAEMAELWELEGPSIYGLAHPRSAVLDSPTWSTLPWEDSDSESLVADSTLGVPSEVASDTMTDGPGPIARVPLAYNVYLQYKLNLAYFQPATSARLKKALQQGHVNMPDLGAVLATLPSKSRPHHLSDSMGSTLPPLAFSTGAYVYGPMIGLHNNTTRYELPVLAVASIIRSLAPFHKFSSFAMLQNVAPRLHRDQHNKQGSANLLFPLTLFEGGELWLQSAGGQSWMSTHRGEVLPLICGDAPLCQFFDPHKLHCTLPWSGDRVVVAAYTIRDAERLSERDCAILSRMGFLL